MLRRLVIDAGCQSGNEQLAEAGEGLLNGGQFWMVVPHKLCAIITDYFQLSGHVNTEFSRFFQDQQRGEVVAAEDAVNGLILQHSANRYPFHTGDGVET